MNFNCSQCGACCMKAGELGIMPSRKDGACIHLGKDNLCKIYEERPKICNLEKMFASIKKKDNFMNLTKTEYFKIQSKSCNELQEGYNMDKKYRLDLEIYNREI